MRKGVRANVLALEHVVILQNAEAVSFDVDSTVICDEGINLLAEKCGVDISELTSKTMDGDISFRDALKTRLNAIQPTQEVINQLKNRELNFTAGIQNLVQYFQQKNIPIYLISGGFYSFIENIADSLAIPRKNIYANRLIFDDKGTYTGFDINEPTSESHGKLHVVANIKQTLGITNIIHFGDGITDWETKDEVSLFVAYTGIKAREAVVKQSECIISDFNFLCEKLEKSTSSN